MLTLKEIEQGVDVLNHSGVIENTPILQGASFVVTYAVIIASILLYVGFSQINKRRLLPNIAMLTLSFSILSSAVYMLMPIEIKEHELVSLNALRVDLGMDAVDTRSLINRASVSQVIAEAQKKRDDLVALRTKLTAIGIHADDEALVSLASLGSL